MKRGAMTMLSSVRKAAAARSSPDELQLGGRLFTCSAGASAATRGLDLMPQRDTPLGGGPVDVQVNHPDCDHGQA